jgi:hypothetical protein
MADVNSIDSRVTLTQLEVGRLRHDALMAGNHDAHNLLAKIENDLLKVRCVLALTSCP